MLFWTYYKIKLKIQNQNDKMYNNPLNFNKTVISLKTICREMSGEWVRLWSVIVVPQELDSQFFEWSAMPSHTSKTHFHLNLELNKQLYLIIALQILFCCSFLGRRHGRIGSQHDTEGPELR